MRVGSLVYATHQGLGMLAKAFYERGVVTDVLVVRHPRHPTLHEWYPNAPQTPIRPFDFNLAADFCASMDVMLFFETPFDWRLIDYSRQIGVGTALMTMYECTPERLPAEPNVFLCPSKLDLQHFPPHHSVYLPVPVDIAWRQRTRAEVFVHNAGWGGLRGRNGTAEFLEAIQYVKSAARFVIRAQKPLDFSHREPRIVQISYGTHPYDKLWNEGDVFVFPEKFCGLSLSLQEARAAGMLVMASDRFPINDWLPREPLIPVREYRRSSVGSPCREFDEAVIDPRAIAGQIDEWYGRDITDYSLSGRTWAESMSWEKLKPHYEATLLGVAASPARGRSSGRVEAGARSRPSQGGHGLRIVYVAKHDSGRNDDEGAICHALAELGHQVQRIRESEGVSASCIQGDLLLFHSWRDWETLARLKGRIPLVFWYFDLVDYPDPTLQSRNQRRRNWMREVLPHVDLGFCTDGDWVARDSFGKLTHLLQGADSRAAKLGTTQTSLEAEAVPPILFTGTRHGGHQRASFVDEMTAVHGAAFHHIEEGIHGQPLAHLIARSQIVVAPDGPVTDRYWSNRVYQTLAFGGFLLHPYCEGLTEHYTPSREIVYYHAREELHEQIRFYLGRPHERQRIAAAGHARTLAEHTYTHRCRELVRFVQKRL